MKIACLHVLPLEYYPPARNALAFMSRRERWSVRAWTSRNRRGLREWTPKGVEVSRPRDTDPRSVMPLRIGGYLAWHIRAAAEVAAWKPDALLSIEPHSALAAWIYYRFFRGSAPLFIHHHEYYAPADFSRPGMRLLRATMELEREYLFARARWVSETNAERLRLLLEWNTRITPNASRVWPNYPPADWVARASATQSRHVAALTRFIYLGSASFEDTYIREVVEWVAKRPAGCTLHVAGDNIAGDVRDWLRMRGYSNVTFDFSGVDYGELPRFLSRFDVGLVLYRGSTLNFVHNVPNKAVEYLASGLEVWYPREMTAMTRFRDDNRGEPVREMDFRAMPETVPHPLPARSGDFPFTSEGAIAPLLAELDLLARGNLR